MPQLLRAPRAFIPADEVMLGRPIVEYAPDGTDLAPRPNHAGNARKCILVG